MFAVLCERHTPEDHLKSSVKYRVWKVKSEKASLKKGETEKKSLKKENWIGYFSCVRLRFATRVNCIAYFVNAITCMRAFLALK